MKPRTITQQRGDILANALSALKRIRGADGILGLRLDAGSVSVPLMADNPEWRLLKSVPDLLDIAIWAHYEMQEKQENSNVN
jgi:hypothetical protein